MLHRWSEFLLRRAALRPRRRRPRDDRSPPSTASVSSTRWARAASTTRATESARRSWPRSSEVFGNKSVDVVAIYRSEDLTVERPGVQGRGRRDAGPDPGGHDHLGGDVLETGTPSMVSTDKHATTVLISLAGDGQADQADNNERVTADLKADDLETEIAGPWAVYNGRQRDRQRGPRPGRADLAADRADPVAADLRLRGRGPDAGRRRRDLGARGAGAGPAAHQLHARSRSSRST